MARQRAKGISYDTSGFANAARLMVEAGRAEGAGKAALGAGLRQGLESLADSKLRKDEQARQDKRFEAQQDLQKARLGLEAGRLNLSQQRLIADLDARAKRTEMDKDMASLGLLTSELKDVRDKMTEIAPMGLPPDHPAIQELTEYGNKVAGAISSTSEKAFGQAVPIETLQSLTTAYAEAAQRGVFGSGGLPSAEAIETRIALAQRSKDYPGKTAELARLATALDQAKMQELQAKRGAVMNALPPILEPLKPWMEEARKDGNIEAQKALLVQRAQISQGYQEAVQNARTEEDLAKALKMAEASVQKLADAQEQQAALRKSRTTEKRKEAEFGMKEQAGERAGERLELAKDAEARLRNREARLDSSAEVNEQEAYAKAVAKAEKWAADLAADPDSEAPTPYDVQRRIVIEMMSQGLMPPEDIRQKYGVGELMPPGEE